MSRPYRTVDRIYDGDTIRVKRRLYGTRIIRLAGVDTPERREPGYGYAKQLTKKLLYDKKVTIQPIKRDVYGRLVAKVFHRGRSISRILQRKGY